MPSPNSPSANFLIFGTEEPAPEPLRLRAGPLTLLFESHTGFLRQIRLGKIEVLRAIYGAVRDRNWETVPPQLEQLELDAGADTFRLRFGAACRRGDIDFYWRGDLAGAADGTVSFQFDGEARSAFLRSRIGLCALHPLAECAGRRCVVESVNGKIEEGLFPALIAPEQVFKNLRAVRYELAPGLEAEVRCEGETFETEDQRNWGDASFKTYGTPLELPYPAPVEAGTRIQQSITLRLLGARPAAQEPPPLARVELTLGAIQGAAAVARPPVGLGIASHEVALAFPEVQRLKQLGVAHLRADLALAGREWPKVLQRAVQEARQLGAPLHVALLLTDNAVIELQKLAGALQTTRPAVSLWMVLSAAGKASEKWLPLAEKILGPYAPDAPFALGTNANFAELNRNRPSAQATALPCFSVNPQVHVRDDLTLVENLEALPYLVESARAFAPRPVVVSPVTLRPRFNAVATAGPAEASEPELPAAVDTRQLSLFAAAWTLGSLARLCATGQAHSLTYFETSGWRGLMEPQGSPRSDLFPAIRGGVFPLFHVFGDLTGLERIVPLASPAPQRLALLAGYDAANHCRLLLGNLTPSTLAVRVEGVTQKSWMRMLDETNARWAMDEPEKYRSISVLELVPEAGAVEIVLRAHAYACVNLNF
jgi:hypothetical protein